MKSIAIVSALIAVMATATAQADPAPHRPGSPIKQGKYCWVYTNSNGAGFWDSCDETYRYPRGRSQRGLTLEEVTNINGGGGDGGGGGGGQR